MYTACLCLARRYIFVWYRSLCLVVLLYICGGGGDELFGDRYTRTDWPGVGVPQSREQSLLRIPLLVDWQGKQNRMDIVTHQDSIKIQWRGLADKHESRCVFDIDGLQPSRWSSLDKSCNMDYSYHGTILDVSIHCNGTDRLWMNTRSCQMTAVLYAYGLIWRIRRLRRTWVRFWSHRQSIF